MNELFRAVACHAVAVTPGASGAETGAGPEVTVPSQTLELFAEARDVLCNVFL